MFTHFKLLKDTVGYSASALVSQGLGLVTGLWIARLLGPSDFGIWNAVSLVLAYGAYLEFGVLSAMGRDLPFHLGRGDDSLASSLEAAARWATIVGAVLASILVVFVSYRPYFLLPWPAGRAFLDAQPQTLFVGLRFMAGVLILQQIYAYHRIVLRSHNSFGELGRQQLFLAIGTSILGFAGVVAFGLKGRLTAAVIAQAAIVIYAITRHPWRALPRPSLGTVWALMRVGLPITASGYVISLISTVDRPIVLAFLDSERLGYLGLALLLTGTVSLVPATASQVLYPRITFRFGESGGDVAALRSFVLRPPLLLARLLPVVIGPAFFVLPLVIRTLLPAYAPGITAMLIVLVGIFFYSILGLTDYFLVTTNRLGTYALFGAGALAFNVIGDYVSLRLGFGIEGVAFVGTPLTYFLYSTVIIGYAASHYLRGFGEFCRYFLRLWGPFVYMVALLWLLSSDASPLKSVLDTPNAGAVVAFQLVLYLIAMVPLVVMAARELRLELSWASVLRLGRGE